MNLQVVQRSLAGGFLTEDSALLNANVRSMFDEARHHFLRGSLLTRTLRHWAALRSQEERPGRPDASCELAWTPIFYESRCWLSPLRATKAKNRRTTLLQCARRATIQLPPLQSYLLAPPLRGARWPLSPAMVLASTCRSSSPAAQRPQPRTPSHLCMSSRQRPAGRPAARLPARLPTRHTLPPPRPFHADAAHGAPATRVHRPPATASWRRGLAQATPTPPL